jgi:hypothetical protein
LRTSIAGKLNNTTLPASRPLAPLYEAIHNSLQAIEDAGAGHHVIEIVIERFYRLGLGMHRLLTISTKYGQLRPPMLGPMSNYLAQN